MDLVYNLLVALHLLGMAAVVGGWIAVRSGRTVVAPILWGARAQIVTGLALVGVAEAIKDDEHHVNNTKIAVKLVIALGRRLRAANERLSRQSFQTVQSRVAAVLDQLVEQARSEGEGGARDVLVTATQAELAQLAGSSRESASRFLAVLERAGVISQGRGRLTVHDPAALRGYVY